MKHEKGDCFCIKHNYEEIERIARGSANDHINELYRKLSFTLEREFKEHAYRLEKYINERIDHMKEFIGK